jgi:quinol monooxygenase YgiN
MYVVTVLFSVQPENVDAFREAMEAQARASLENEEGCIQFDVCTDPDDANVCFLYEIYTDKQAFDAHLASAHFKAFDAKVTPWLVSKSVRAYSRAWPED